MTRDKQIEEMAKALTAYEKKLCDRLPKDKCLLTSAVHAQVSCDYCKISEFLVNAGYRKASDVAREIFEEIEAEIKLALESNYKVLPQLEFSNELYNSVRGKIDALRGIEGFIAELKKHYTEEESTQAVYKHCTSNGATYITTEPNSAESEDK